MNILHMAPLSGGALGAMEQGCGTKRQVVGGVVYSTHEKPIHPSSQAVHVTQQRYMAITLLTTSDWPSV